MNLNKTENREQRREDRLDLRSTSLPIESSRSNSKVLLSAGRVSIDTLTAEKAVLDTSGESRGAGILRKSSSGFTIVEMLIATAIFSVVLLLCATAMVQVGRTYYKGVTINRVQDTARKVTEDVAQSVQFGVGGLRPPMSMTFGSVNAQSICIGTIRYTYVRDRSLGTNITYQSPHVLWKDRLAVDLPCTPVDISSPTLTGGQELLGSNMRIPTFIVTEPPVGINLSVAISLVISYGDEPDLFETGSNFGKCISEKVGGQFCAVSTINTNATKRL